MAKATQLALPMELQPIAPSPAALRGSKSYEKRNARAFALIEAQKATAAALKALKPGRKPKALAGQPFEPLSRLMDETGK